MLSLLAKDFRLMFARGGNRLSRVLSVVFTIFIGAAFVALETVIFSLVMRKISAYDGASSSFFTLFLFIIALLETALALVQAKRLFFSDDDVKQLATYPISNGRKVVSKLFFLVIIMYALNLVFSLPLFIAYGVIFEKVMKFFYTALYYPLLASVFEIAVALIFVYPFKKLVDFLKAHSLIQAIVTVLLVGVGAYLYGNVLNLFIGLVAENNLSSIFNATNVALVKEVSSYLVPVNFLIRAMIDYDLRLLAPYVLISLGLLVIGLVISITTYGNYANVIVGKSGKKRDDLKVKSVKAALIEKEFILLFRNSDNLLSFSGPLLVMPFLAYTIVGAINTIFNSGSMAYYSVVVPSLTSLTDVMVILFLSSIISAGANNYIQGEKRNLRLIKSMPVPFSTQLGIKVSIPLLMASIMAVLSCLLLGLTGTLSWTTSIASMVLSVSLISLIDLVSLYEELKIKTGQNKNSAVSTIYSYLFPIGSYVLSVVLAYLKVDVLLIYSLQFAVILLGALPFLIGAKRRLSDLFLSMEVAS